MSKAQHIGTLAALTLLLAACTSSASGPVVSDVALTKATSADGKYSIMLPCAGNAMAMDGDATSKITKAYLIGCTDSNALKYSAMRSVYKGGKVGSDAMFAELKANGTWPGAKLAVGDGGKVLKSSITQGGNCAWSQTRAAGDDLIILMIEGSGIACFGDAAPELADKIFATVEFS
jgi:hypothetical protein